MQSRQVSLKPELCRTPTLIEDRYRYRYIDLTKLIKDAFGTLELF